MTIYLMRHAQTNDNMVKRYTGSNDKIGINANGKEQIKKLTPFLKSQNIKLIFSSPFRRCFETALEVKKILKVDLVTDIRLKEVNYGKWQGLTTEKVKEKFPRIFRDRGNDPVNVAPPEGETLSEMQKRVIESIKEIISTNKNSLVITHGSCIHAILMYYQKINLTEFWTFSQKYKLTNCSISEIIFLKNKIKEGKIGWYPKDFSYKSKNILPYA